MSNQYIIENPVILIDGSYYLYRAYYAITAKNIYEHSNESIYCIINMIYKILIRYRPSHAAIIFDAPGKTFRHILFNKYKIHRAPMPTELKNQMKKLYCILNEILEFPILSITGVESDDVIGTLTIQAIQNGRNVLIMTADKDLYQLVNDKVTILTNLSYYNKFLGPKEVETKIGIPPNRIIDYLALVGDRSDNIPGIPGIGNKTALFLLRKLNNFTMIYNDLNKIESYKLYNRKKIIISLKTNYDIGLLSYNLATINTNVNLNFSYNKLAINKICYKKINVFLKKYKSIY